MSPCPYSAGSRPCAPGSPPNSPNSTTDSTEWVPGYRHGVMSTPSRVPRRPWGGQAVPSWVDPQPLGAEDLTVGELGRSRPAHRALELTLHHRIPTALAFVEHRWPVGAGVGDPGQASHDQSDARLPPELAAVHATAGAVAVENMHQVTHLDRPLQVGQLVALLRVPPFQQQGLHAGQRHTFGLATRPMLDVRLPELALEVSGQRGQTHLPTKHRARIGQTTTATAHHNHPFPGESGL